MPAYSANFLVLPNRHFLILAVVGIVKMATALQGYCVENLPVSLLFSLLRSLARSRITLSFFDSVV